eukprot:13528429-Alexandrium_andersonii.AAC.1
MGHPTNPMTPCWSSPVCTETALHFQRTATRLFEGQRVEFRGIARARVSKSDMGCGDGQNTAL